MHIMNAMFARGLGGIEQAFFDYTEALLSRGHEVTALHHPESGMLPKLEALKARYASSLTLAPVPNFGFWDPLAILRLRRLIRRTKPAAIITHGNRAAMLLKSAARTVPVVALAHNYSVKRLVGAEAVFAITQDIARVVETKGQPADQVFVVPNMLRAEPAPARKNPFRKPVVIGTMGRFVEKKGFADFIEALSFLKSRSVPFKAVLGGDGEEKEKLLLLAKRHGLGDVLSFPGWVEDKRAFFESIDIFCLPSRHEPFGIVLLEAFAAGIPIITTNSEGPAAIATHGKDALIVPKANPRALADAFTTLFDEPDLAARLAAGGLETLRKKYDMDVVAAQIEEHLRRIIELKEPA